jgi:hypothetical protein
MESLMNDLSYKERLVHIEGLGDMIKDRISQSWQPYFVNFMFNHIPGRRSAKIHAMTDEAIRVYNTLLPNVDAIQDRRPGVNTVLCLWVAPTFLLRSATRIWFAT